MPRHNCPVPGRKYATENVKGELVAILFKVNADPAAHRHRDQLELIWSDMMMMKVFVGKM